MTKYEYKLIDCMSPPFPLSGPKAVEQYYNDLGAVGWELIEVNPQFMVWKRPRTLDVVSSEISEIR
jgi:hypothetical protein